MHFFHNQLISFESSRSRQSRKQTELDFFMFYFLLRPMEKIVERDSHFHNKPLPKKDRLPSHVFPTNENRAFEARDHDKQICLNGGVNGF